MIQDRTLVLVLGEHAFDRKPFSDRRLILENSVVDEAISRLGLARALIVAEPPGKFDRLKHYFETILPQAEEHGLTIRILIHSEAERTQIIGGLRDSKKARDKQCASVDVFLENEEGIHDAAEQIARAYMSPLISKTSFEGFNEFEFDREKKTLFLRAFYDAEDLHIRQLTGGFAAEGVYRVHAFLKGDGGRVLGEPQPFFVKFASHEAIERERQHYQMTVAPCIPYDLRPNLDKRRCVRGSKLSAIVGNMVEGVSGLRKALKEQLGFGVISNLFERTLSGLRARGFEQGSLRAAGLETYVSERIRVGDFQKQIATVCFAKQFDKDLDPVVITQRLIELSKNVSHRVCLIHNDLHDGNVFVRSSYAIVIDFERLTEGPLTADPCCLEVSLLFKTENSDDSTFDIWRTFVDSCYDCSPSAPEADNAPHVCSWQRHAVREIRKVLFGCNAEPREILIMLATHLLRFARLDIELSESSANFHLCVKRHAYALVIASKIVKRLTEDPIRRG